MLLKPPLSYKYHALTNCATGAPEASFIRTKLSCSELLIIRPEARLVGMGAEVVEEVHEELILPTQL